MQQKLNWKPSRPVLSITQIVDRIRFQLETEFEDVWVEGEVSNLKRPPSGHCYFTLKDQSAQLRAVCFRLQLQMIGLVPRDGAHILARGRISVYPPRGEFQIIIEYMEPAGAGALQLAFEKLKRKLAAQGLFAEEHKQTVPMLPSRLGVLTSPSGAALQDILRVLKRRNNRLDVLIYPTRVQGEAAEAELVRGIRYLDSRKDVDVIIIGRGGGSLEDLWAFNSEELAQAIFKARKPVISAVGHEIDFTICDFVADVRAPTPSAAAEMVSSSKRELSDQVHHLRQRNHRAIQLLLARKKDQLQRLKSRRVFVDTETRLRLMQQRLDELQTRLRTTLPLSLPLERRELEAGSEKLEQTILRILEVRLQRVQLAGKQLFAYSPQAALERGYAVVSRQGEIVRDPEQLPEGEEFQVKVARGDFRGIRKE